MTTYTATIPSENIAKLFNEINKLNRKAVKLGCQEIDIHLGQKSYKKVSKSAVEESNSYREYIEITIDGPTPKFDGWTFLARIEHTESGNIVNKYEFADKEIPYEYRHTDEKLCEHCNTRRHRNNTYLVTHEDGEVKQVGSNCLKDFLGFNSPERVLNVCTTIESYISQAQSDDEDSMFSNGGFTPMYGVRGILAYTASLIEREGFKSAKHDEPTGSIVELALDRPDKFRDVVRNVEERHYAKAQEVMDWVCSEPLSENDSEYMSNLKVAMNETAVSHRNINLLASSVHIYDKEMDKIKQRQFNKQSEHLGNVKERIDFGVCEITFLHTFETMYGTSMIIKFRDVEGNNITWFSSKLRDVEKGESYNVVGTVKKHDEYKGIKETHIKNARLYEV